MENTDSERSRVCPTWKPEEARISRAPAYSVQCLKICYGVGRRVATWNYRTDVYWAWPGVKINGASYRDVLLGQHLLPAIRSVQETSSLTMLQLTELVTAWSFVSQYTRFHLTFAVATQ